MASTSTNKQPLMVDRVLHNVVDLAESVVTVSAENTYIDLVGANSAQLLVDCTKNDGAVIGEIYANCRAKCAPAYEVALYFSRSFQYLTPSEAYFVGGFYAGGTSGTQATDADGQPVWEVDADGNQILDESGNPIPVIFDGALEGERVVWNAMPEVLNPVPCVGSEDDTDVIGTAFKALYVPRGMALWAAVVAQHKLNADTNEIEADRALAAPLLAAQGGYY